MDRRIALLVGFLGLASCEGPWNGLPPGSEPSPRLQVGLLLVADRPFDTLLVETPRSMGPTAIPGRIDTHRTRLVLHRLDGPGTLPYHAATPNRWAPDTATRVPSPSSWALEFDVVWTDSEGRLRSEEIRGVARVPANGGLAGSVSVPTLLLSREGSSGGVPGAELSSSARDSLARNLDPMTDLKETDTLWSPSSHRSLPDPEGSLRPLGFLPLRIPLKRDPQLWSGVWVDLHYDSTRARILGERYHRLHPGEAVSLDSLYRPGNHHFLGYFPAHSRTGPWWPGELRLEVQDLDVVGPVVVRIWFPEPGLFEWWEGQESSPNGNHLDRSTVTGAVGWFVGARVDSFLVQVGAHGDTVSARETREAWCARRGCGTNPD